MPSDRPAKFARLLTPVRSTPYQKDVPESVGNGFCTNVVGFETVDRHGIAGRRLSGCAPRVAQRLKVAVVPAVTDASGSALSTKIAMGAE